MGKDMERAALDYLTGYLEGMAAVLAIGKDTKEAADRIEDTVGAIQQSLALAEAANKKDSD